ncbi:MULTISPECIES: heavy metal translocating P-type ATPase [Romboutsia]|uniref:heavy metal translocating P-type ATPase n=1 Tax=Romboutsia TaxID=1501226 RepID=UPI001899A377|nr:MULTISPECIES: heavy metal translocating P-type ATPase [Romboutsia]MCH1959058.1 cadmium-translocating P-type ATPase [Romboutsia hominis]MCH1968180.1 cadmium-translocating P-type ATPase [Romboutsia hominis]MDB8789839.1 heavy metal translocating P-type ATPase [Romboutsia sp. 1001216sp1]MDB8794164.1 heavy metal translocating P-type ATPase [Romboutsia sp. 1001216sp1]MDB8797193.1 heavy metal translocating P-type ATPase [Romboutsia sp. 1001216sp1]
MDASSIIRKELILGGLNCAHCAEVINEKVSKLEGVESSNLNFINKKLVLNIQEGVNEEEIIEKAIKIINDTEPGLDIEIVSNSKVIKRELILGGLNCAHCAEVINEKVSKLEEIDSSNLNFINKKLTVNIRKSFDEKETINKIVGIVNATEPGLDIQIKNENGNVKKSEVKEEKNDINKKDIIKLVIGSLVYIFGIYQIATGFESKLADAMFIIAYVIVGGEVLLKALKNAIRGQVFDENFLMSIATIGALAIGELPEAVGVMLFYQLGEFLQGIAVGKSRRSITSLMKIRPDYANLKEGSELKVVSPEEVKIGDVIVVKPGEKVPLDGVVIDGYSMVDTSALTGESVLREVSKGESVLSGFINKNALLTIEVTKGFEESTVSKILDLVENASSKKSKTENFITKFSKYYTPAVVIGAVLVAVVPPIIIPGATFSEWLYRGLVFLVVSCPCALVLSIPLSFFSGIGFASKNGILIKGSNYLEALRNVDTVVFDKTGTLTKGVFNVTKVNAVGISEEKLLEYAAFAEANSNHPIAKSILSYYDKKVDLDKITSYEEIAAYGIKINYNNELILAGNEKLMKKENIFYSKAKEVGTVVYIAVNQIYRGYIVISDEVKEDSKKAIKNLKSLGIKDVVMLTGDNEKVATAIAKELGVDKVYSNLLPNEKVDKLEKIYEGKSEKEKVIFVGDGINDAPVLARADIGIAMGGLGSDAAIEAADVVLMTDEPSKISKAIEIANKTNKIVWQNIIFALAVKAIVLILGAGGVATMWEAIFADVGVALIAVLNAMRAMR